MPDVPPDRSPTFRGRWCRALSSRATAPPSNITGVGDAPDTGPLVPVGTTVLITALWVLAVVSARVRRPLLTLVYTGPAYAVFSTVLSAVSSPIMAGELRGPPADPLALVGVLAVNALGGHLADGIASVAHAALQSRQDDA